MSEISGFNPVSPKVKITSKNTVSLDKTKEAATEELKNIEISMEEANHAFALMTEIRQKIETAYKDITSNLE